jgi:hypothetical protein
MVMQRLGACLLSVLALVSCSLQPPGHTPQSTQSSTPLPNTTHPVQTPGETSTLDAVASRDAAIQATLDRYGRAYNNEDTALLATVYDTSNPPLRRLFSERFTAFQDSVLGDVVTETYRLKATRPLSDGFVLATVERASDDFVADWTFREIAGQWLLAEPTAEQVGERVKTEREGITFYTYPWNNAIKDQLIDGMLVARSTVKAKLGTAPERPLEVIVRPIFGVGGIEAGVPTAYYTTTGRDTDRLVIYGPQSLAFVFYDPAKGWQQAFTSILVHEYTHLVTNRSFVPLSVISDWMSEGVAEYVRERPRPKLVRVALREGRLLPIRAESADGENTRDLEHLYQLGADRYLGYGLSYELVAYIVEQHGGLDGFWKLCQTYAANGNNLDAALQESFGISYPDFEATWEAWLRQRYASGEGQG